MNKKLFLYSITFILIIVFVSVFFNLNISNLKYVLTSSSSFFKTGSDNVSLNIYLSSDGNDLNDGTYSNPINSLSKAYQIARESNAAEINVNILSGTYNNQFVNWQDCNDNSVINILGDSENFPIFDGTGTNEYFLKLYNSNSSNCKYNVKNITIQNYTNGIYLINSDLQTDLNVGYSTIEEVNFYNIGDKYSNVSTGYSAIDIQYSNHNTIKNCEFNNIEDTKNSGLMHAVYLAHHSNYNLVYDNTFYNVSSDPIRVRNSSNNNKIYSNTIEKSGKYAYFSDWFGENELISTSNEFYDNTLESSYNESQIDEVAILDYRYNAAKLSLNDSNIMAYNNTINSSNDKRYCYWDSSKSICVYKLNIASGKEPTKKTYIKNREQLDLDGGYINVIYAKTGGGVLTELYSLTHDMFNVSGFDNTSVGTKTITIQYDGQSTSFDVEVIEGTYTINFNSNGGNGYIEPMVMNYDETKSLNENQFEKSGYTFNGWNTSLDGSGTSYNNNESISNLTEDEEITLYAQWQPITYTIYYNLDGGTATNKDSYTIETETFTLNNPTKEGYTFIGWTNESMLEPNSSVTIEKGTVGNKTFTANYEINNYTITFNSNNELNQSSTQTVQYNTDTKLNNNTFTNEGMIFKHWNTKSDGTGNSYSDEQVISINSDLTLYAIWEEEFDYSINNYNVDETNKYISNIVVNTPLNTFTANFRLGYGYGIDVDYKEINNQRVLYTGGKTRITHGLNLHQEYTNVVIGDVNGNGKIDIIDYIRIMKDIMDTEKLSGVYALSADVNNNNKIDIIDYIRIMKIIMEED